MKHASIALIALALGLVLAQDRSSVQAQGKNAPAKGAHPILICDFAQCVDKSEEAKDMVDKWQSERKAAEDDLRTKAEKLQKRIQDIQAKTKLSERDEKTYNALKAAIEEKGQLEGEMAYRNVRDQDFIARRMLDMMRGAKQVANGIMLARGAHMVIGTKTGPMQLQNQKDLQDEMLRRRVVCFTPAVDITAEVMKALNAQYAKRKAAKGG
ncbi:MAG: OmpH/Skp family outer membrane protein [Planctomycetota bacterium]|jgi:Skp family chaperone for outer membrane proteins